MLVSYMQAHEIMFIFLRQLLAGKITNVFWHSLSMHGTSDFSHWANGAPLTYKTGWAAGNPAQFPSETCSCFE